MGQRDIDSRALEVPEDPAARRTGLCRKCDNRQCGTAHGAMKSKQQEENPPMPQEPQ